MRSDINKIQNFLQRVECDSVSANDRTLLVASELTALVEKHPGIPTDYVEFMREIGWGALRESVYMIYSGFVNPDEIIPGFNSESEILCFGDDFGGDPAGFIPSQNWKLVEIFHEDHVIHCEEQTFVEFLSERLYMGRDGNDLSHSPGSENAG